MNRYDDHDPDEMTQVELIRRIRELERDNRALEEVLADTFETWLIDRKRLAQYEHAEFIASITHMKEHPETAYSFREVLDELERESGHSDRDRQVPD
jgi:hypothetical protein